MPNPLGATVTSDGVNLAVWAPQAELVEACVFDDEEQEHRFPLLASHDGIHHGFFPGGGPGVRYGLRAHGPWDPARGMRFNPHKLLVDPYAKALDGDLTYGDALVAHAPGDAGRIDDRDTAGMVPRGVVVADPPLDGRPPRPGTSWSRTVIYEMHVKGFTARHPDVPAELRGTYAGLVHPAPLQHLLDLGVTAVELLPIHHFVSEPVLAGRGMTNYWGYNTLGFFAPHAAYSSSGSRGEQVTEFRAMVDTLHEAGIEVILDVVYNHTCESGPDGPTLSFRGLGDSEHYKLVDGGATYFDVTGCGNTVDAGDLGVLRLVTDSLRYWVTEMGVDGFRFDLASALAREALEWDPRSPFLAAVHQDPVLRTVKLIAEPWDVGSGGYRLGEFGPPWSEWNDRYRGAVREFWRGAPGDRLTPAEMGWRVTGSQDLFWDRSPRASVNFVTAHDGFTLRDLVSYDRKHNEGNGEDNRDGTDDNRSWNHGVEGDTDDPEVIESRGRTVRAVLATLLLSTGTPMLLMGDELGHTQDGNNNAYCRDDETTWLDWDLAPWQQHLLDFTRALVALRSEHPTLRQNQFFEGRPPKTGRPPDLAWLTADGAPMPDEAWHDTGTRLLLLALSGELGERDRDGHPLHDNPFLLALNSGEEDVEVRLPESARGRTYVRVFDTAEPWRQDLPATYDAGSAVSIAARSVAVLRVE
jgi:glycogen operon protein